GLGRDRRRARHRRGRRRWARGGRPGWRGAARLAGPRRGRRRPLPCRVARRRRDARQRVDVMRVIIADDAVIIRQGVARLLAERGVDVVGEAGRTDELLRLVAALRPDVAVIDIRMPPTQTDEGLVAAREIRRRYPTVGTLVLSQHAESGYALELVAGGDGSVGYLLK